MSAGAPPHSLNDVFTSGRDDDTPHCRKGYHRGKWDAGSDVKRRPALLLGDANWHRRDSNLCLLARYYSVHSGLCHDIGFWRLLSLKKTRPCPICCDAALSGR